VAILTTNPDRDVGDLNHHRPVRLYKFPLEFDEREGIFDSLGTVRLGAPKLNPVDLSKCVGSQDRGLRVHDRPERTPQQLQDRLCLCP
jgi:hypothetical protein